MWCPSVKETNENLIVRNSHPNLFNTHVTFLKILQRKELTTKSFGSVCLCVVRRLHLLTPKFGVTTLDHMYKKDVNLGRVHFVNVVLCHPLLRLLTHSIASNRKKKRKDSKFAPCPGFAVGLDFKIKSSIRCAPTTTSINIFTSGERC